MPKLDKEKLEDTMKKAKIPGVSIAYLDTNGVIGSKVVRITDLNASNPLPPVKPVIFYPCKFFKLAIT